MRKSLLFVTLCTPFLAMCAAPPADQKTSATSASKPDLTKTDITLTPDFHAAGTPISEDFLGFSFETRKILPDSNHVYYFRPDNVDLVSLIKSLGIKSLRIGGNTADRATVPIPTNADIDSLYAFARAADVQVIYNLRLKNTTDPSDDVRIAKHIMAHYKSLTSCFTLGNEPDFYFDNFSDYLAQYKKFSDAILTEVPDARFCGPSTAGHQEWATQMAQSVPHSQLAYLSVHTYPGGNAQAISDPDAARAHILSPDMEEFYQHFHDNFVPAISGYSLGYRLEECNSLYNGGATNISNSFASTLWALDFMYWWASHGAAGVNFHTGTNQDVTSRIPGGYDAFWSTPTGFKVHPISYALKAFDIAAHGKIIPLASATGLAETPNVTAYAVVRGKELYLTIMNRQSAPVLRNFSIAIQAGPYTHAEVLPILAPNNDAAALEGVTLGNAEIEGNGAWKGQWSPLVRSNHAKEFVINLPATSAAIVRLTR